jgi:hypothetical protein
MEIETLNAHRIALQTIINVGLHAFAQGLVNQERGYDEQREDQQDRSAHPNKCFSLGPGKLFHEIIFAEEFGRREEFSLKGWRLPRGAIPADCINDYRFVHKRLSWREVEKREDQPITPNNHNNTMRPKGIPNNHNMNP